MCRGPTEKEEIEGDLVHLLTPPLESHRMSVSCRFISSCVAAP